MRTLTQLIAQRQALKVKVVQPHRAASITKLMVRPARMLVQKPVYLRVGHCKSRPMAAYSLLITTNEKRHGSTHALAERVQCQAKPDRQKTILACCLKAGRNVCIPMDEYFSSITVSEVNLCYFARCSADMIYPI